MTTTKSKNRIAPGQLVGETADEPEKERVAKVMARAGLCSRRDAESWIKAGRVAVNGTVITSPALNIGPDDKVTVDGAAVEARERTRLFLYHKPRGLVTTAKDPEGRPTVFDSLPDTLPRLISVGRLDINTEGLLLLTNDGGLARVLELPSTGWLRRYRVRANGKVTSDQLEVLKDGITIDGIAYAGIEAALDRAQGANVWLTMGLREGKNREIKRVLEHLGLYVNRLIRLSFGPFQLGELAEGEVEEVRTRVLRDQLGEALARNAGVDWEDAASAPVVTQAVQRDAAGPPARDRKRSGSGERNAPAAPEPRRDRPKPTARPHVSALRAARSPADSDEPRKRTTRTKTEDRKGRTVAVERIVVEDKSRHTGDGGTSRNARNFARQRRDAADGEAGAARPAVRTSRAPASTDTRPKRSRGFGSDRPATGEAAAGRSPVRTSRAPAGTDAGPKRSRGFGSDRPATVEAGAGRPAVRKNRAPASTDAGPKRNRGFGSDRPATGEAGAGRPLVRTSRAPASTDAGPKRSRGFGSDRPATGRALKDAKTRGSDRSEGGRPRSDRTGPKPGKPPGPGGRGRTGPRGRS